MVMFGSKPTEPSHWPTIVSLTEYWGWVGFINLGRLDLGIAMAQGHRERIMAASTPKTSNMRAAGVGYLNPHNLAPKANPPTTDSSKNVLP